jgi:hypothetical protein
MLRRRIALLCPLLSILSLACEKPPATDTTTPADATPAEPATTDTPAEAPLPPAEEVLAKSIEALGGRAAIEAVKSSYTEAKTEVKSQGMTIALRIWTKGNDTYVESDMPGLGMSQMWKKGDDVWSKDPINGLRKLEGKEAAQARWSTDPLLAVNWKQYFEKAETVRRVKEGEQELLEVKLSSQNGDELVLVFDEKTGLPAGQAFKQETPMGAMAVRVKVEDYREVEGVKVPFRSITDMQLAKAEQTIEKYEVNVEIDDAKLQPPTPGSDAAEPAEPKADEGKAKAKPKGKAKSSKAKTDAKAEPKADAKAGG